MHSGHDARTQAVIEQARRKSIEKEFHTETRQELPVEFQTLIIATAEDLASLNLKMIDFERRLAEAEAEVEELKSLKSVTLNDLMKKSA